MRAAKQLSRELVSYQENVLLTSSDERKTIFCPPS